MQQSGRRALRVPHVHAHPPLTPASFLWPRRHVLFGLGLLFAALAISARFGHGSPLLLWDEPIQRWVEASRTPSLDTFFLTMSRLGSTVVVLAVGGAATLLTWRRCHAVSTAIFVATLSRPLLEFVLKLAVGRSRPDLDRMVDGVGYSFPSGHVMASVALWGLLPMVVGLYTRNRKVWWGSVVVSGLLIVTISSSRTYLGVHWFSDVVGGLVLGTFFLLGVEAVLSSQHQRRECGLLVLARPTATEPSERLRERPLVAAGR